jgi:hypothetical protein
VDESPAETENNIRAPAPKTRYRPIQKERWPWFTAAHVFSVAVVLLVLGGSVYFMPDPVRDRARQWVRETYRTYFPITGEPSGSEQSAVDASQTANPGMATVDHHLSPEMQKTPLAVERRLRMPSRPPDLKFPGTVADRSPTAPAAKIAAPSVPPAAAVTMPPSEPPDPADAIDWLLKKRGQELSQ